MGVRDRPGPGVEAAPLCWQEGRRVDPVQLRRLARRALAAVEDDASAVDAHEDAGLRDEEAAARDRTRLTLHDNGDGTTSGHFTVPTPAASILRKALDTMTAPRRSRPGATRAQGGDQRHDRNWAHDRGLAFTDLLEHLPTDRLHGKVAATVVVTLDLDTLRGKLRAKRVAGATRHTSCAADGCEVPYACCELHHRRPWSIGGGTDLADMVPLCGFHHRRTHDPTHLHRRLPDGSIRFTRRT